mmetsp:Transcript_9606/g.11189  ORF Transcript_9606/g.11189 Transcript_9606/m.11189 type:complete len:154 (-) Transcript_9606:44-505(-)
MVDSVKHRFAYRIRIENFNEPVNEQEINEKCSDKVVQLLGRTWKIIEDEEEYVKLPAEIEDLDSKSREVNVVAPTTGAVGNLPVIRPGEAFEYMSGCELGTVNGTMGGCFHMAIVDDETESAQVGDPVDAFKLPSDRLFELEVAPFKLSANTT